MNAMPTNEKPARLTYAIALEIALNVMDGKTSDYPFSLEEVKAKLTALRDKQEARSNAERKPTEKQNANALLIEAMLSAMEGQPPLLVKEIMALLPDTFTSPQHATALLRLAWLENKIIKIPDGRAIRYAVAN